jgi:hypothetical protein
MATSSRTARTLPRLIDRRLPHTFKKLRDPITRGELDAAVARTISDAADAAHVARALEYRSAAEVKAAVYKAAHHLALQVRDRPYAMFVNELTPRDTLKSTHWLTPIAAKIIGRWPEVVVTLNDVTAGVQEALRHGVQDFVTLDDASYSGTQFFQSMMPRLTSTLGAHPASLHIAVGFATPYVRTRMKALAATPPRPLRRLTFYAAATIPNLEDAVREDVRERQHDALGGAAAITVMAHKLPDDLSFPDELAQSIRRVAPRFRNAPYKDVDKPMPMRGKPLGMAPPRRDKDDPGEPLLEYTRTVGGQKILYVVRRRPATKRRGPVIVHHAYQNVRGVLKRRPSKDIHERIPGPH